MRLCWWLSDAPYSILSTCALHAVPAYSPSVRQSVPHSASQSLYCSTLTHTPTPTCTRPPCAENLLTAAGRSQRRRRRWRWSLDVLRLMKIRQASVLAQEFWARLPQVGCGHKPPNWQGVRPCVCVSVCMAFNIYSAWNIFIIFFSFRLLQRLTNGFAACGFSYCSVGCCSCCSWCLVRWLLATLLFSAIWPLTIDQANPWRESAQRFFQRFIYLFRFNASWLHCVPTTYSSMSMSKSVSISCSLSLPLYRSRSLAPRFREVVLSHW